MSNDTRLEAMDDKFWEEFADAEERKNKLLLYKGIGFIYVLPASRKNSIVIDIIKSMEDFNERLYVDINSKTAQQARETYDSLNMLGWKYFNTMLQGAGSKDVVSLIKTLERNSVVIINTWDEMLSAEKRNDKSYAKKVMKKLKAEALKNDLLIVLLENSKKDTAEEDTITNAIIEYHEDTMEPNKMKPKEAAVTQTLLNRVNEILNEGLPCSIGELRDWLYDNYNSTNEFLPDDKLFCSNRYLRDNFVDFTESLFIIEKIGRRKFIRGFIHDEHAQETSKMVSLVL